MYVSARFMLLQGGEGLYVGKIGGNTLRLARRGKLAVATGYTRVT